MKCEEIEKLLPDYLSGNISASQRQLVEEHLSRCTRCRKALAAYNEARQYLTSLKDSPVPLDFTEATMIKIKALDTAKSVFRKWLRPALGTAAAVIIIVVLLVTQPWGVSPQSVMAQAYAATESLQSYRMLGSFFSTIEGETVEQFCAWEFTFPDRHHGELTLDDETYEFIIVGDKQYTRELGGAQSGKMYAISLSGGIPTKEDTLKLLDSLTNLEKLPDEKIEGVDCIHYRGKVDVDRMIEEQKAKLDPRQPHYQEMLEGLEAMRGMKVQVELWIGKEDHLIRQLRQDIEVPLEGTSSVMMKYYDFNEPITIEPPLDADGKLLPGWELAGNTSGETHFYTELNSEITGEDPAHSQISLSVTITNVGMETTASNVRVELRNSAVIGDNGEAGWINAEPLTSEPVNLEPGESAVYSASWGYDASHITRDELTEQLERTVIRITYITPEGNEATRMYSAGGAPYPTAVPPERPPD